jgi:hypothetical protein
VKNFENNEGYGSGKHMSIAFDFSYEYYGSVTRSSELLLLLLLFYFYFYYYKYVLSSQTKLTAREIAFPDIAFIHLTNNLGLISKEN